MHIKNVRHNYCNLSIYGVIILILIIILGICAVIVILLGTFDLIKKLGLEHKNHKHIYSRNTLLW